MSDQQMIDGVAAHQLAWVRVTGGQDVSTTSDGTTLVSTRPVEDTLKALGKWAKADDANTRTVSPNLHNSLHGALNHHVTNHSLGSWAEKSVVVVAPLDRMIQANGVPATLDAVDTYWRQACRRLRNRSAG